MAGTLRNASWLLFFGGILAAWWWLFAMTAGMGLTIFGQSAIEDLCLADIADLGVLIPMWGLMTAAMMGPTFVPAARTYEDLITAGAGTRPGFLGFVGGYLGTWLVCGIVLAAVHRLLVIADLAGSMGSSSATLSGLLLIAAGAYQFSALKDHCLSRCRSPMSHFLADWRPGSVGGAVMGARIGIYCVGCCWVLMLLGLVGGTMNLVWMGVATLIMTLEKLPDLGRWLTRPLGIVFLAAGTWQILVQIHGG